ncbi:hypothetical protein PhaeoP72_00010 [Phaeobacter inhibens]|nr:hypothetical protein PhaeoP30_00008 [Phaeobacter inhibens]AUQ61042.1 hypothetical protein PhaeoP51_00010 [Phaeobacter inhibens]AUQ80984.1 hypothetical protein PhaeoP57_00010 [Phaeobacter inhibens]AUQ88672.1 hypothetical protein PhaeoP24_00010 [Phaeobacter inhibens]AUR02030.1 hypothetical protein PhaeoP72_00010 [Phaeobacter inhibens]
MFLKPSAPFYYGFEVIFSSFLRCCNCLLERCFAD